MRGPRLPVGILVCASLFFAGATTASTIPYAGVVAIEELKLARGTFAALILVGALIAAAASLASGWLSDKTRDRRRWLVACALIGVVGHGLIYGLRNRFAFVVGYVIVAPFAETMFPQAFSYARSYYDARAPKRSQFMMSVLRTCFSAAWILVPPVAGWFAAAGSAFDVFGIASAAYLACVAVFGVLFLDDTTKVETVAISEGAAAPSVDAAARALPWRIGGGLLIMSAIMLHAIAVPLAILKNFGGTIKDVGLSAGLAASLEVPFTMLWGLAARRIPKHVLLAVNAVLYALYLVLLSRAHSMAEVLCLQTLNAVAVSALFSLMIAYLQEAIRGRVGLSTSLYNVVLALSVVSAAGLFALASRGDSYRVVFLVGAALAVMGAVMLLLAQRRLPQDCKIS